MINYVKPFGVVVVVYIHILHRLKRVVRAKSLTDINLLGERPTNRISMFSYAKRARTHFNAEVFAPQTNSTLTYTHVLIRFKKKNEHHHILEPQNANGTRDVPNQNPQTDRRLCCVTPPPIHP